MQTLDPAPRALPQGPKNRPILGAIPEMKNDPIRYLTKLTSEYPGITYFKIGFESFYFVSDADYVRHILLDNASNYHKLWGYDKFYPIFGQGLLTSNGDFWKKQRKLTQPAFHKQRLEGFARAMADRTQRLLDEWSEHAKAGTPLELGSETRKITMDIVTETLFSLKDSRSTQKIEKAINLILDKTYKRMFTLAGALLERVPTPSNIEFNKACRMMEDLIYSIIAERRSSGEDAGDLLSMYMLTKDEDTGEGMSDRQLKDELMTIFFAGHETSAHSVAWACCLLSTHPEVARKVDEELKQVLGGRKPCFEDIPKLVYLRMVIEESMRLLPPSWIMSRTAIEDDLIGGYHIPKGSVVIISEYTMHHNPRYWHNPEEFDPERFRPGSNAKQHKYAYLAFGQGPRSCIGSGFAMMEMQIILSMILQKFSVDLVPTHPIVPEPVMTLRPKHGVMVTITPKP